MRRGYTNKEVGRLLKHLWRRSHMLLSASTLSYATLHVTFLFSVQAPDAGVLLASELVLHQVESLHVRRCRRFVSTKGSPAEFEDRKAVFLFCVPTVHKLRCILKLSQLLGKMTKNQPPIFTTARSFGGFPELHLKLEFAKNSRV